MESKKAITKALEQLVEIRTMYLDNPGMNIWDCEYAITGIFDCPLCHVVDGECDSCVFVKLTGVECIEHDSHYHWEDREDGLEIALTLQALWQDYLKEK